MRSLVPPRVVVLIACLLLAGITFPVSAAQTPDAADAITRALGLAEQGDGAGARRTLAAVDADDPLLPVGLGAIELMAGKLDTAEPFFRAALTKEPRQPAALWGLSLCLLQRGRAYEAITLIDRATAIDPDNVRLQALRAYACLQLGQISDAALAGKTALDGGGKSPFLMATLAQIHYRMGFPVKAVEFSAFSARYLYGLDLSHPPAGVHLPLTITVTDTPAALIPETTVQAPAQVPAAAMALPEFPPAGVLPRFQITSPVQGSVLRGRQQVAVAYRGNREIAFVTFLVDGVLRGMASEMPYQFIWDSDAVIPGTHALVTRAYAPGGLMLEEAKITVSTTGGRPLPRPEPSQQASALQQRIMALTMPMPAPLSLFTTLGFWHQEMKEIPQAISALEKSAAIDPLNETVLGTLRTLYREQGLHLISSTGDLTRGPATGKKRVALTFDDGPNPLYTPAILEELARCDAHATFFLVGKMVQRYPDLALKLLADGHELANHTYHHPNLTKLAPQEIVSEMLLARSVIRDVTGRDTYLFRPPGGNIDDAVTKELRALDYNTIYWTINAGDYKKSPPAEQAALVMGHIQDGSIVLMHNGPVDGTLVTLPILLAELARRGFTCVTVSELMKDQ